MHVAGLPRIYAADVDPVGELITFNMLPDDVLLGIFDLCVIEDFRLRDKQRIEGWQMLAHVCRRPEKCRFSITMSGSTCNSFAHPKHLRGTPWTSGRLCLSSSCDVRGVFDDEPQGVDNIIAVLERNNRVSRIELIYLTSSQFGYVTDSAAMHKPFPELTDFRLDMFVYDGPEPILPDSFLGWNRTTSVIT
ncbi:hypothetical protein F5888DRAFT_1113887 [Russula emetica]|nr:hypothetical protein F5888DRAFT_1113887 [Russula emetica]